LPIAVILEFPQYIALMALVLAETATIALTAVAMQNLAQQNVRHIQRKSLNALAKTFLQQVKQIALTAAAVRQS
jgi:hypothetical protein